MLDWRPIAGFDGYSVSSEGDIRNDFTGFLLKRYILQNREFPVVGLMRQGRQFKRSVARLVANAYLEPHKLETFDTPICLDGDRTNCKVNNLTWRPLWFAVAYNRQFIQPYTYHIDRYVCEKKSGLRFLDSFEAAKWYGVLEKDLVLSILNRTYVWPVYLFFEVVEPQTSARV